MMPTQPLSCPRRLQIQALSFAFAQTPLMVHNESFALLPTHCKQEDSLCLFCCLRNNQSPVSFSFRAVVVVVMVADWFAGF